MRTIGVISITQIVVGMYFLTSAYKGCVILTSGPITIRRPKSDNQLNITSIIITQERARKKNAKPAIRYKKTVVIIIKRNKKEYSYNSQNATKGQQIYTKYVSNY